MVFVAASSYRAGSIHHNRTKPPKAARSSTLRPWPGAMMCMSLSYSRCDAAMARPTSAWGARGSHSGAARTPKARQSSHVKYVHNCYDGLFISSTCYLTYAANDQGRDWKRCYGLGYGDGPLSHVVFDVSATATTDWCLQVYLERGRGSFTLLMAIK